MPSRPTSPTTLRIGACLLIGHVVLLFGAFSALAPAFGFPEVLRLPAGEILERFRAGRSLIVPVYYVFTLTGLSFAAFSLLLHEVFRKENPTLSLVTCSAGVLAGLCQALGFIRWCFVVPVLADAAADPAASQARRDAAVVVFEALHHYAGVALGENLAFVLHALWTVGIGSLLLRGETFDPRLGPIGIGIGVAIGIYSLEQFGGVFSSLGPLNVVMHDFWAVWLLLIASLFLLRARSESPNQIRLDSRGWTWATIGLMGLLAVTHL
ncbi:MAG: DUF4386 domain-containing protein [bacterium]|nr:DUF4386 domain-containing protein [bacterium]